MAIGPVIESVVQLLFDWLSAELGRRIGVLGCLVLFLGAAGALALLVLLLIWLF